MHTESTNLEFIFHLSPVIIQSILVILFFIIKRKDKRHDECKNNFEKKIGDQEIEIRKIYKKLGLNRSNVRILANEIQHISKKEVNLIEE